MKIYYLNQLDKDLEEIYFKSELYLDVVLEDYSYTKTAISYYEAYYNYTYSNRSLIVFEKNEPILVVYIFSKDFKISFFDEPIKVHIKNKDIKVQTAAYRELILALDELIKKENIHHLIFKNNPFLNANYHSNISQIQRQEKLSIALDLDETLIQMNLRKSYKSLINWGKKNLNFEIINFSNLNQNIWNDFKNLHIKVAGKKTRSDITWELQYESIAKGDSFLIMSYLNNLLVGGTYVLLGNSTAYYGVGAYDRELMAQKLPISHFNLLISVYHAKKLNKKIYELGYIDSENSNPKERDIFNFKKGFTNMLNFEIINTANFLNGKS